MYQEHFYKIRDKRTGLFKEGGHWPRWSKKGKEWTSVGHVKQHLSQFPANKIDWDNWEMVEYAYEPVETGSKKLGDLLSE